MLLVIDYYNVGKSIKDARKKKNITRKDLAASSELLALNTLYNVENDKFKPSIDTLVNIAKALDFEGILLDFNIMDEVKKENNEMVELCNSCKINQKCEKKKRIKKNYALNIYYCEDYDADVGGDTYE
ncbi:MAG: helix-turn-helix transcriptional regulator [Methanobrevibacter sp.]|nr:helix-turn-helix transcriptional regulator [Methanobrevibacter sp.]